eukprot:TRINITY_DN17354_c0_g1_i1.p1 TRINITY_DN17354_c0_g1~~TRINITY_DN17354_c0_g1_i1.p1  ORF type:complete len:460 (+),score=98.73 TRINITY_DN17354_c0_g1_i1:42-1421(+)
MALMVDSRVGAFSAFDLDGTGEITQFDLRYAFQACEPIAKLVSEKEVIMAMRRVGVRQGSMIRFEEFCQMCDVIEGFLRPKRQINEYASALPAQIAQEEVEYAQTSPRRTTRSIPLEAWHENDDTVQPAPLPESPRSPRACLGELPGMDQVAHAFYAFDMDYSGAVSAVELPSMLRMVIKRKGGNLGRPSGNNAKSAKAANRWDSLIGKALAGIGKQRSDLLNLHDFQGLVDLLDPPPPPLEPEDEGYETTESEKQRRAEEAERLRREEEARQEAERINAGTIVVQYNRCNRFIVLQFCEVDDGVDKILRRLTEEVPDFSASQMRLLGRGFEMDPRNTLAHYGIKIGHPQTHGGDILQLLIRQEFIKDDSVPEAESGMVNVLIPEGSIIQVHAWVDEPIEHFMTRIEEVQGTPVVFQRLLVHGRELNSRKTLEDYEVTIGPEGDIVELLMRDEPAIPKR